MLLCKRIATAFKIPIPVKELLEPPQLINFRHSTNIYASPVSIISVRDQQRETPLVAIVSGVEAE